MIQITDKSKCCGCNACGDACAHKAITFHVDMEGFWYPVVDKNKCSDCGLCEKVCPIINVEELKKNDFEKPICYAAEHKNIEVVFDSTSGGLFSALADIMYKDKGFVGGAIFNDDFSVRHYISSDKRDLPKLRSSKYLQSNCEGFFKQVREQLKAGEKVLVCGCPCQMAALRAFLRKDYDNLIIVDFICRAIDSPKAWRRYLDMFEDIYQSKIIYSKTKIKEYGWRKYGQKFIFENGKTVFQLTEENPYQRANFQKRAFCRPSCFECKFKGYPRMADITIADFWGIEKIKQNIIKDKNIGISCVMVNSKRGEAFFERVKSRVNFVPVQLSDIEKGNSALLAPPPRSEVDRELFFKDMDAMRFDKLAEKYGFAKMTMSRKQKVKKILLFYKSILDFTQCSPSSMLRIIRYNSFKGIFSKNIILFSPYSFVQFAKGSLLDLHGILYFGSKKYKKSKMETKMLIEKGGILSTKGKVTIGYGSDIEIFQKAHLSLGAGFATNIECNIICADKIEIGKDVGCGRNVTIRDNNGGHYINTPGYKNTAPIIIGDKVWLCESCTIMPGVKIGDGAIVGARSVVYGNIPPRSLVSGNPAKVVMNNILWKD